MAGRKVDQPVGFGRCFVLPAPNARSCGSRRGLADRLRGQYRRRDIVNIRALSCLWLAGTPLDENLGVTVIIDLCVKCLKERLELATKDMQHPEVREDIVGFIERRHDNFGGPRLMEVYSNENEHPDA